MKTAPSRRRFHLKRSDSSRTASLQTVDPVPPLTGTLDDAFEIASDAVGRAPTITHLHTPPVLVADVK